MFSTKEPLLMVKANPIYIIATVTKTATSLLLGSARYAVCTSYFTQSDWNAFS